MTSAPEIDVRDLNSVRSAARDADALSESAPDDIRRTRGGVLALNKSPIARKIITFNLVALMLLVAGVLYLNPSRDNLTTQRAVSLTAEAELIADVFEAQMPAGAPVNLMAGDGVNVPATIGGLDLRSGATVLVFDTSQALVAMREGTAVDYGVGEPGPVGRMVDAVWSWVAGILHATPEEERRAPEQRVRDLLALGGLDSTDVHTGRDAQGRTFFVVSSPIEHQGARVGMIALTSSAGEIDALVRQERGQLLRMFFVGLLISVGLSLILASTIANPLSDLAAAAESGRDKHARKLAPSRVRIPDLTGRPDEIGRLSGALRGMVAALYDRIEANEQFAADVSHEIKNPLASLRSAVGTMRVAQRPDQREKLLEVIEHDVQRLDRLVSDISNASRLDSELVKEEELPFDLIHMLSNLSEHLGDQAREKGIDFISDLPQGRIEVLGLEGRLAQVFVNLLTNAMSFCEEGDAIRIWARHRENRVIIVVEDTGPGIPEQALTKIFQRFYSQRPEGQFGNNSGLGLAISKQIVEAHSGVIWAENIRPTETDVTSEPLGARFVVGLPV